MFSIQHVKLWVDCLKNEKLKCVHKLYDVKNGEATYHDSRQFYCKQRPAVCKSKIKMIAFNFALMKVIRLSLGFNLVSDLEAL